MARFKGEVGMPRSYRPRSMPDWLLELPLADQVRLIEEQRRVFEAMLASQGAFPGGYEPYMDLGAMTKPRDVVICGVRYDGSTGERK